MFANQINTGVNGRGYFWQPWFITSDLNVSVGVEEQNNTHDTSRNDIYSGRLQLALLPVSKFPLQLALSRSDSAIDQEVDPSVISGATALNARRTNTTLSVLQSLLSTHGRTQLSYITSDTDVDGSKDSSTSYGVTHSQSMPQQNLDFQLQTNQNEGDDGDYSDGKLLRVGHRYYPSDQFSAYSEASSSSSSGVSNDELLNYTYVGTTDIAQAGSTLLYYSQDRKFYSSAALRFVDLQQQVATSSSQEETDTHSSYLNVHNNYRFNDYVSTGLDLNSNLQTAEGEESKLFSESASLMLASKTVQIAEHDYSANSSISYGNYNGSEEQYRQTSLSVGHALNRDFPLGREMRMRYTLGQSYTYTDASNSDEVMRSVSHNASVGLSRSTSYGGLIAHAAYAHSHTIGSDDYSRKVDFNLTHRNQFNLRASLNASISYQNFIGSYDHIESSMRQHSANLDFTYQRPFDYARLTFRSFASTIDSTTTEEQSRSSYWRNELNYMIGKLRASLDHQVQWLKDDTIRMTMFQVSRSF